MWWRKHKSSRSTESAGAGPDGPRPQRATDFATEFERVYTIMEAEGPTNTGDFWDWAQARFGAYSHQSPRTEATEWRRAELTDGQNGTSHMRLHRLFESKNVALKHPTAPAVFLPRGLEFYDDGFVDGPYDEVAIYEDAHLPMTFHDPGPRKLDVLITLWGFAKELSHPRQGELAQAATAARASVDIWHIADEVKESWARIEELQAPSPTAPELRPAQPTSSPGPPVLAQGRILPPGVVQRLERTGQHDWYQTYGSDGYGPYLPEIEHASPERQSTWVAALAEVALPVGGWTAYGAAQTVVTTLGTSSVDRFPNAGALVDASLEFQRESGVWLNQLSPFEKIHWQSRHPDQAWLTPRDIPSRQASAITPIPLGSERKVSVMSRIPDSNEIWVAHKAPAEYVAIVDMPVERGEDRGRVRQENDSAEDLYTLYLIIGRLVSLPNHWNDPELEPFFPYPRPQI